MSWELALRSVVEDEGGYTSVAFAVALVASLSLVFACASAVWLQDRAADAQSVADATALSGSNVVAAYSTVAEVLDASVLTMGLAGVTTMGAGLVASAVPGLSAVGAQTVKTAKDVLDARQRFATSAAKGLKNLEATLPYAIVARSQAVAAVNSKEGTNYLGAALPFPAKSESDFSNLDKKVETEDAEGAATELQQGSEEARQAKEALDDALRKGWEFDCGNEPRNLQERAEHLAGLPAVENPDYPTPEGWDYNVALRRAQAYYRKRASADVAKDGTAEERGASAVRKVFYGYASKKLAEAAVVDLVVPGATIHLPELPGSVPAVKETTLYTDASWPTSKEEAGRTIHSFKDCPGFKGTDGGPASVSDLESGKVRQCGECKFTLRTFGNVFSATTNTPTGFEYHWQHLVEASKAWNEANVRYAAADGKLVQAADKASGAFDKAIKALEVPRPKLRPPGAWGCVAVVGRGEGTPVPSELTKAFGANAKLPAGVAVAGATLAPDDATKDNDVLSRFFDGLSGKLGIAGDALQAVTGLWSTLLEGYGSGFDAVAGAMDGALGAVDGVLGGTVGAALKDKISGTIKKMGLEPSDLRLKKPVIVNSGDVLGKAGYDGPKKVNDLVQRLPQGNDVSPVELARALGQEVVNELGDEGSFTVAEVPIPGSKESIPLKIDVKRLLGAA